MEDLNLEETQVMEVVDENDPPKDQKQIGRASCRERV